jgi:hypothetical protein
VAAEAQAEDKHAGEHDEEDHGLPRLAHHEMAGARNTPGKCERH